MCIIQKFERELKLHGKAESTIKSYSCTFKMFVEYFKDEDIRYLSNERLKDYIYSLHGICGYTKIIHSIFCIRFYYKYFL